MSPRHVLIFHHSLSALFVAITAVGLAVLFTLRSTIVLSAPAVVVSGASSSSDVLSQVEPTITPDAGTATELFLPMVAHLAEPQSKISGEAAPPLPMAASSGHIGNSPISPPLQSKQTFVADTGGDLDKYLYRSELEDGRLRFTIDISTPVAANSLGSDISVLQLQVFDVDHDAFGCAEVDHVWVNGWLVGQRGTPTILRSGDNVWDTWTMPIPTYFLRFPLNSGDGDGAIQPVPNEIAVEVDTQQCFLQRWALEVDWGAIIVRPSINYGLLFVHGWTGNQTTFKAFHDFAKLDGYEVHPTKNYSDGIDTVANTARSVSQDIFAVAPEITDKVFIVAHSRGGLLSVKLYAPMWMGLQRKLPAMSP